MHLNNMALYYVSLTISKLFKNKSNGDQYRPLISFFPLNKNLKSLNVLSSLGWEKAYCDGQKSRRDCGFDRVRSQGKKECTIMLHLISDEGRHWVCEKKTHT
jgi:hypothetical protein